MEGLVANVLDRKEGKCDGALMQERGGYGYGKRSRLV